MDPPRPSGPAAQEDPPRPSGPAAQEDPPRPSGPVAREDTPRPSGAAGREDPILRLFGVVAGYGAGDILKGVDLRVAAGTVTCLIGPNGAGKSTVLKTISGLLRPDRGVVEYRDQDITGWRTRARLLAGIAHVP